MNVRYNVPTRHDLETAAKQIMASTLVVLVVTSGGPPGYLRNENTPAAAEAA